jgi:hypothetical protein
MLIVFLLIYGNQFLLKKKKEIATTLARLAMTGSGKSAQSFNPPNPGSDNLKFWILRKAQNDRFAAFTFYP